MPNLSQSFPKRRSNQTQPALYPISGLPEYPNAQNVLQFLKQTRITETPLTVEHVESLLNVLVLDGEIERVIWPFPNYDPHMLSLFIRFLRMAPLSGVPKRSRTMPSLNLSVIPRANENTDLGRTAMAVREARARNGRIAIRNWTTPLLHHEKRRAESQNAKTETPTTNQSERGKNPGPATATVTMRRRKTGRRNERRGPGQVRKNRKAENNLRTSLQPPRLTLVPNQMNPPGVGGLGAHLPSQGRSRKPRNPLNDRQPLHRSRNSISRAWGPLMYTGRYDQNVRSRAGPRHHALPVRVSSSVTTKDPSTRRTVSILGSG